MAASNTAFMFWIAKQQQSVTTNTANEELNAESSPEDGKRKRITVLVGFLNCIRCRQLHQLASSALRPADINGHLEVPL